MTTLPTLTTYAADACDARLPAEFDAERVVATYVTAQRLREMRDKTPRPQLRRVNELVMLITAYLSKRN